MGAGRLFVLISVLAAPAGAVVSPFEALEQGPGLELRDAENRLVSRGEIAQTLKNAQRQEAAVLAAPAVKAWADFVESARSLARSFRVEDASSSASSIASCTASREPRVSCPVVLVRLGDTGPAARPWAGRPLLSHAPDRALNLPLRC